MWSFLVEVNLSSFLSFVYICIVVGDPVVMGEGEIQLSWGRVVFMCIIDIDLDSVSMVFWCVLTVWYLFSGVY
jgi:hypothetical protein